MANFIKLRTKISRVEHFEDDFKRLCDALDDDSESFVESIEQNTEYCWIDDEDEPYTDLDNGVAYISFYVKSFDFDDTAIGEFCEYFRDNYVVSIECVFCDENEDTQSVGVYKLLTTSYDENEGGEEPIWDVESQYGFFSPKDDNERHQMFLMSWNGWRCYGRSEDNFFNQLGLNDEDFYIKEYEDDSGILPQLDDWLENYKFGNYTLS